MLNITKSKTLTNTKIKEHFFFFVVVVFGCRVLWKIEHTHENEIFYCDIVTVLCINSALTIRRLLGLKRSLVLLFFSVEIVYDFQCFAGYTYSVCTIVSVFHVYLWYRFALLQVLPSSSHHIPLNKYAYIKRKTIQQQQ